MINFTDGKTIKYTYCADGRKLRAAYTTVTPVTSKTVDYCGNLIFENGQLKQVLVDGGYIPMDDWSGTYRFYVKDHLGNNRMVVHQSGTIEQVNNYYPYGGLMSNSTGWNTQRYKYNGKEMDRMYGLDWLDYGARMNNTTTGLWTQMDLLAEKYYHINPYVYCAGNPVRFIDSNGLEPTPAEAAAMALHVYGDKDSQKAKLGNWRVSKRDFGISLNTSNGLKSMVYEKVIDGKVTEYAYVTCGTETLKDWVQNAAQLNGMSKEYYESAKNAKTISDILGKDIELTYIGHSQGGGEAALNSLITSQPNIKGRKAITFNAAGVSAETKLINGGMETFLKSTSKIDAYVMMTCPLNIIQNNPTNSLPHVNGNIHLVTPKSWDDVLHGHSMLNMYKALE